MTQAAKYLRNVQCGDELIPVYILRSRRKTMAIHVFPDRPVELRAPLKCPWTEIESFLDARRVWIQESLVRLAGQHRPCVLTYGEAETHYYLGSPLKLRLVQGRTRHVSVNGDTLVIRCDEPDNPSKVQKLLESFYRSEGERLFPGRIDLCRQRFKVDLSSSSLTIRKMRARWGSCSREGEICLNSLLMQKPVASIDFVITHELCHLRHFAHNKSFYHLMDQVMPDWRQREKLLSAGDGTLQLDLF